MNSGGNVACVLGKYDEGKIKDRVIDGMYTFAEKSLLANIDEDISGLEYAELAVNISEGKYCDQSYKTPAWKKIKHMFLLIEQCIRETYQMFVLSAKN